MQVFTPKVSSVFAHQGRTVRFVRGRTTIEEGHPILKGREDMVEPLKIDYPVTESAAAQQPPPPAPAPPAAVEIDATPRAIELAGELKVDLEKLKGKGRGENGRITADDVKEAAA